MAHPEVPDPAADPEVDPRTDAEASPETLPMGKDSWGMRLRPFAWPIVCLFQLGIVTGLVVAWWRAGPPSTGTAERAGPVEHAKASLPTEPRAAPPARSQDLSEFRKAEEFFRDG